MTPRKKEKVLTPADFEKGTFEGLKKYEPLSFLEQYAMYMGVSQLIEISLKQLLERKFGVDMEKTEKLTLGQVSKRLRELGLREDFFHYLDPVIVDRNYIAHDLIASDFFMNGLFRSKRQKLYTKDRRRLTRATIELERLAFLISWCNDNDGWN